MNDRTFRKRVKETIEADTKKPDENKSKSGASSNTIPQNELTEQIEEEVLDILIMSLMVAGAIEADNSADGKLTPEIMYNSRAFKPSKSQLLDIVNQAVVSELEKIDKEVDNTVIYMKNDLPNLLSLDRDLLIRKVHKDEIHKIIKDRIKELKGGDK